MVEQWAKAMEISKMKTQIEILRRFYDGDGGFIGKETIAHIFGWGKATETEDDLPWGQTVTGDGEVKTWD